MKQHSKFKRICLGLQHVLAMFGATVLVPALTGLDTSITLFCAGVGTLLFHLLTKRKVPVFLGSSFAFMGGIISIIGDSRIGDPDYLYKLSLVKGSLIIAGLIYIVFAFLIKLIRYEKVNKLLPPIVTGPIIIVIGIRLSSSAINNAFYINNKFNLGAVLVTVAVLTTMIIISVFTKGLLSMMSILFGIIVGFIVSIPLGFVDFSSITNSNFFSFTDSNIIAQLTTLPRFELQAILAIAPISLVTLIEHVGDITTNSAVVDKNFITDPGIHRTILGDGVATAFAGFLGGPANTTYGENTGVLALTKNYDPSIIRIAACFSIILGIFGKVSGVICAIPTPVIGAISIVLYGMISAVGIRILLNAKIDLGNSRNLIILAIVLVFGIGCDSIPVANGITVSGLALAALIGMILAQLLPEGMEQKVAETKEHTLLENAEHIIAEKANDKLRNILPKTNKQV